LSYVGLAAANPRRFWSSIFDSEPVAPQASLSALTDYFEDLLNPAADPVDVDKVAPLGSGPPPADITALARLADPLSVTELTDALQELKTGRAADIFGLKAELVRLLLPYVSSHLCPLFNRFFLEGFPRRLSTSVLIPIYKGKGDTAEPSNFRGISITPILSKLYACILERRLSGALDLAQLRADSQFGFRRRRGTREAAFVLRAVVEAQKGTVFCAFVDFQKAFDSVQRPLLWRLLRNLGVPEPFVLAVESYYARVEFRVEHPSGLGDVRCAGVGVRQGCPLSPVLFGVFVEALLRRFLEHSDLGPDGLHLPALGRRVPGAPDSDGGPSAVPPILYADDLTLLAQSIAGLQRQLDRLQEVAADFGLKINVSKTKVMAMGPKAPEPTKLPPVYLAGEPLEWVSTFRYLGLRVHYRQGFASAAAERHASALSKYYAMIRQCKAKGVEDAESLCLLFDSLVGSVLGYGGPIWAPDVFAPEFDADGSLRPSDDPHRSLPLAFERLQRQFMRYALGLPRSTPHLPMLVESQRPPLALQLYKHTVRFLAHLRDESVFPPGSLVRRALAASADYYSSPTSWLRRLQAWSEALGAPFDLAACLPEEAASSFAVTPGVGGKTRAARAVARPRPLPPPSSAISQVFGRWTSSVVAPALTSYPFLSIPSVVSSWKRRPPDLYRAFPRIRERSTLSLSRLHLPVGGRSLFSSASTDLRTLDPDPLIASDITALSLSFHVDPTQPLTVLLSSPPKTLPSLLRTLSSYLHIQNSHASRPDLLRKFPQLGP
jgi:hypothetical protein